MAVDVLMPTNEKKDSLDTLFKLASIYNMAKPAEPKSERYTETNSAIDRAMSKYKQPALGDSAAAAQSSRQANPSLGANTDLGYGKKTDYGDWREPGRSTGKGFFDSNYTPWSPGQRGWK